MKDENDFFRSLGVEPPDDEEGENESNLVGALRAIRDLITTCATIRNEAARSGFSAEEAYDMVMTYYGLFLSTNFAVAHDRMGNNSGEEES